MFLALGLNRRKMIFRLYMLLHKLLQNSKMNSLRRDLHLIGTNVEIDFDTVFVNAGKIILSDDCKIYKGVYIKSRSEKSVGIKIGKGVKVHEYTYIDDYGGQIVLDDYVGIGHHCVIGGHGNLYVGKYTMIAGLTYIIPANHTFKMSSPPYMEQEQTKKGIHIGSNVWIGAGCIILDGVNIGDNSVVAAGSIVTKDIPSNTLVMGYPARPVKEIHRE